MRDCRHHLLRLLLATLLGSRLAAAAILDPDPLPLGSPIPDFALPGVDGRAHTLKDFAAARILVIVVTCNHCPTSQAYERRLMELHERYRDRSVALVAVSPNDPQAVRPDEEAFSDLGDTLADMQVRAKDRGFAFPYLYDGERQTFVRALGAQCTPHAFVFDRERKLRYQGAIDEPATDPEERQFLRDAIENLLADRPVTLAETVAHGCSVKWSVLREEVLQARAVFDARPVGLRPLAIADAQRPMQDESRPAQVIGLWTSEGDEGRRLLDTLVTLHRIYARRGVRVISICLDRGGADARVEGILAAAHASCDNYHAGDGDPAALAKTCDPQWTAGGAHLCVVVPGTGITWRKSGPVDLLEARRAILAALGPAR